EILGIRLGQLDGRLLRLPATQTKNRRRRIIPLTRKAHEILVEAMSNPLRPDDTDLVFWGDGRDRNGNRKPWDLERAWRWARSRAGISDLRFHDLRHEAISRFGEMGIPPLLIAAISGHRDLRMLQRYSHPDVSYILKLFDERIGPSGDF
ncbi:site-specific integrase, partial [Candidatus Parcubacteria bacterium]